MQKNIRVYIAFSVMIFAMVYLLVSGFESDNLLYNLTVKELIDKGDEGQGQGYRIAGKVIPGSVEKAADRVQVRFSMMDIENPDYTLQVVYDGILPDTFKEGNDVMVEGTWEGGETLKATNIMTKCASKYDPAEEGSKGDYKYNSDEKTTP